MISYNLRIEYLKLMFLDKPIRICTQLNFVEESPLIMTLPLTRHLNPLSPKP